MEYEQEVKLPFWRLITGLAILTALATVLLMLAPVYIANYRFQRLMTGLVTSPSAASWSAADFRQRLVAQAQELALPVEPDEVKMSQSGGRTTVEIRYAVRRDFGLYQVDLHFRASARR
jgi:hypothetical protein